MANLNKISRELTYILRHDTKGLSMNKQGYIKTVDILNHFNITMIDLKEIVRTNNKQRFSFNEDKTMIRANQGHSLDVDVELEKCTPPTVLYHGTSEINKRPIMKKGILRGSRTHVHLSDNIELAYTVGKRHSKDVVIIEVDCKSMLKDGYEFYKSVNGVWLVKKTIEPKYLTVYGK